MRASARDGGGQVCRDPNGEALAVLARDALAQIAQRGYDAQLPAEAQGRLRWGVAFSGKRVVAACKYLR